MSRNQSQFSFSLCLQIKYIPLIQFWLHFQCQIMRSWFVFSLSHHFISTGVIGGFNFVVVVIMSISVFLWSLKRFSFSLIYLFFFSIFLPYQQVGISSVQFTSVSQSCPTLCDPMNRSTPGLPVYHQLPEFTQTHIHWVSDAIQPSHPLSSPSPPAPNPSQHQSFFQWFNSSHEVAKVLEFQL